MTDSPIEPDNTHSDPTLDQQAALSAAVERLRSEFDDIAADDDIDAMVRAAYAHVADHANIDNFLPLLAERYTRELLKAADAEHHGTRTSAEV
ncbi:three-helix bundle dimerization domain-containing protein [Nocardia aurea]|uniref:Protein-tyrosine-phosphatase-like N-terminal domain-containing protein n=1 Tax=Nocardia aurea TaxID=2144174 RepID=A0ABV3FV80_9NOCA